MACIPAIKTLELTLDGKKHFLAAPIGDRDPMEVTLGEWMGAPALSGALMMDWFMDARRRGKKINPPDDPDATGKE